MDFFLEIHNGECGLGEHFCDPPGTLKVFWHRQKLEVRTKNQDEEMNKESALS